VPCRVVCISHATGAGGVEVGRLVAERLGFLYVDEEIVADAAAKGGLEARDIADEEKRKSLAGRIVASMSQGAGGGAMALGGAVPFSMTDEATGADVRALIRETIEQTASRGDVVIVAHAASHALERGDHVLRVLVTASPDVRAKRIGAIDGGDERKAAKSVADADAGRRDYLKRFYKVDEELPTHYDLVVNTDVLSFDDAARVVARGVAGSAAP